LIYELLGVTPAIGSALRRGARAEDLRKIAMGEGMWTQTADGVRLAAEGSTSLAEVIRVWRA
jgi:type II secretory ATPase GspE/PulE/Tfp pilus assembly ATPase PilB-like protein